MRQVDVVIYQNGQASRVAPLDGEDGGYWSPSCPGWGPERSTNSAWRVTWSAPTRLHVFQPQGVHGVSQVVDPAFPWRDHGWQGVAANDLILYEVHTGTATPAGTFEALIERLPHLVSLGVTALELMPVADFPGERNWGYDGVCYYAPSRAYGGGMGLKRLVDAAHAQGLGVLLDVVYNHLVPSGNYLRELYEILFQQQAPYSMGRCAQLRRARRADVLHRERPVLGARAPHRRAAPGRGTGDLRPER